MIYTELNKLLKNMKNKYIIMAYDLIEDSRNPTNSFGCNLAIKNLFNLIRRDGMDSLEDYLKFKDKWYPQLKNRSYGI